MKNLRYFIILNIGLHYFIGFGAVAGGFAAASNPINPLGISTDMLKNGPFNNFLIPGLFLMLILGVGNISAGALAHKNHKWSPYFSGAIGDTLILWIVVQCFILNTIAPLHVIFFILGVVQSLIALATLLNNQQFPFDRGQNNENVPTNQIR